MIVPRNAFFCCSFWSNLLMWKIDTNFYQEFSRYRFDHLPTTHCICSHNIDTRVMLIKKTLFSFQVSSLSWFLLRTEIWPTFMLEELILSIKFKEVLFLLCTLPKCKIKIYVDAFRIIIYFQDLNISWEINVERSKMFYFLIVMNT